MQSVKLDEIHGYAKTALERAVSSGNKEAVVLAEHLIQIIESWADERKEAKQFYEELKNEL
jgi:hypothetical protein